MATRPYLIPIPRSRRLSRTCRLQERRPDQSIRRCMTQYPTHRLGRTCRLRERRPDQSIRHLCPSATRPHGPSLRIRRCTTPHPTRRPCELNAKQNLPRREGQRKVLVASLLDDGRGGRRYQMGFLPNEATNIEYLHLEFDGVRDDFTYSVSAAFRHPNADTGVIRCGSVSSSAICRGTTSGPTLRDRGRGDLLPVRQAHRLARVSVSAFGCDDQRLMFAG
jgi:hypothetical protein